MCPRRTERRGRRGLSLIELLIASSIMLLIAGALGMLAMTAQMSAEYGHGHSHATQHARVALERIERTLAGATASEQFPGFAAFNESVGGWDFPDTLVVWHPEGAAVDPEGLPRFDELVIFCPDPAAPNRLLEITLPDDTRTAYAADDTSSWQTALAAIKAANDGERVELTDLLRTADPGDGDLRGAVRFVVTVRPSQAEWADYEGGTIAWDDINWVQDIHGSQAGLRQAWCRLELQLLPEGIDGKAPSDELALPFFGSAAVYCELER
jgi:prepilin-type N-terminal cleavage/methylation domain-containing protein